MRLPRKLKKKVKLIPKDTHYCYNWIRKDGKIVDCRYCPYSGWNDKDKHNTCILLGIYEWDICISDSVKQCRWGRPE